MDIEANVKTLEQRHQILFDDFQAGKIDDAAFISEIDKLQFQDHYGRYWMIGAQTGAWHYYDGQTWHQADPREAGNLPFMDEQGRYWQRGVKSGDWYYHQPETGEWVKPEAGEEPSFPSVSGEQAARGQQARSIPYQSRLEPQNIDAGPGMPAQFEGELFQDDDGRYWAIGAKTGQWYFYDHDGWHPAHEFQPAVAPQVQSYQPQTPPPGPTYGPQTYHSPPSQVPYQPAQGYAPQPYQPQEPQGYAAQPQPPIFQQPAAGPQQPAQPSEQEIQPPAGQQPVEPHPTQSQPQTQTAPPAEQQTETPPEPVSSEPDVSRTPTPPRGESESGAWYYFDGNQWLRYSSGEPEEAPPPSPKMVIDQKAKPAQVKVESKSEPVVAEFFEDDEPPVEVVDVEVITVIEAEPDEEPVENTPAPEPLPEPRSFSPPMAEDVRPRRSTRPVRVSRARSEPAQPQRRPRERTSTESGRPVAPRKKETAHEPTIIIPTGSTASKISSPTPSPARRTRPVRPSRGRQRRAREDTLPMESVAVRGTSSTTPAGSRRREVTQPMPQVAGAAARSDTAQMRRTTLARQTAQQDDKAGSAAVSQSAGAQPRKTGYTLGDVLRSLPSTIWTFVGGVVLLLICAVGLIFTWSWLQGGQLGTGGLAAVQIPTPTLDAGPPDATPTPGPTPTALLEPEITPISVAITTFSSAVLGFTVEYPEDWQQKEETLWAIFSPSTDGLDPDNLKDAAIWIGTPADSSSTISDLLTTVLADFPPDAETLNEGTISIASQTWTSAQVRFEDENLGGQGIATLAVTSKDGRGYYLVAVAPAEEWNSTQPLFQGMINSFRFSTEVVAQATTSEADGTAEEEATASSTSTLQETLIVTATPEVAATPLTYIVESGDTLLGIAAIFGVDVDLLASENNIENPETLQVGQELIIPFTAEQLAAYDASGDSATRETTPAAESEAPAPEEVPAADSATSTETEAPPDAPAPVGGRIAYAAFNPGTNNYDLWLADIASGEQNVIAGQASQPAFNRDGSLLAYRSWGLDSRGIFFRDFVGGRGGQVTRFVEDGLPIWAPDGFSFAFASRKEGDRMPRIYIGNQMGEDSYSIGFQGEYPAVFPDGRLVVKGCLPSGDCGLYIMGAAGGGETKISGPEDTAPAVSPDGSKIAFMSSSRGATNWEIWVMSADGSNPQRLTENGSNEGLPTWSPDGQSIAYVSDQGGVWAIWVMNADGSSQRKLLNMMGSPDGIVLHDEDNSKGWLEERISWAP